MMEIVVYIITGIATAAAIAFGAWRLVCWYLDGME